MTTTPRVIIVGGGAAGLPAAIAAARHGAHVTVLEAGPRVGRKILASGNGRCNLSNTRITPTDYNHPEFVEPILASMTPERVLGLFGELGLTTYADDEGRVYPTSNAANSVLDVLRLECDRLGVDVRVDTMVRRIQRGRDGGFELKTAEGERLTADAVVVASGGGSRVLDALGHGLVDLEPVLGPIPTEKQLVRRLSGVRVRCAASVLDPEGVVLDTERGELLFRDYGVSGIMVFDLSRYLECAANLSIDFIPDTPRDQLVAEIVERIDRLAWRRAEDFFDGWLHPTVGQVVLVVADVDPASPSAELDAELLADTLKDFRLDITGGPEAKASQVTRGGAPVSEFDPETLESRIVPGLFAAGEVLDVDGRCGGYNLHWAWASGMVAGAMAAQAASASQPEGAS